MFKSNKEVMNAFPKMCSNSNSSGIKVRPQLQLFRNSLKLCYNEVLKLSLPQGSREKALSSAFQDHGAKVIFNNFIYLFIYLSLSFQLLAKVDEVLHNLDQLNLCVSLIRQVRDETNWISKLISTTDRRHPQTDPGL